MKGGLVPSHHPVKHLRFVTSVGEFDELDLAIAACREDGQVIGTGENIHQEWQEGPVRRIATKGGYKPKVGATKRKRK